jgi:hypothetical protein
MVAKKNGHSMDAPPPIEAEWMQLSKETATQAKRMGLSPITIYASLTVGPRECRIEIDRLTSELRGYEHGVREGARIRGVLRPELNPQVTKMQAEARALRALAGRAVQACISASEKKA